ncbi:sensor histidine kinase [Microbacterium sp. NPDC055683]
MSTAEDVARRAVVDQYRIVGEPPEPDLEGIVRLAATLCGVSTAVINIIDDRSQHQIAAVGLEPAVCSREDSMCAVVIRRPEHVVVPDAREDARFAANPFVTGEIARVRFYASSPLVTPSGVVIGTLCVFDEDTGELPPDVSEAMDLLARQVIDVLELRRMTRALGEANAQLARFAGQVSHDLRNPLTALSGFLELAADSPEMARAPQVARAVSRAESAAERMTAMIADLLAFARAGGALPRLADVDLGAVALAARDDLDAATHATRARIEVDLDARVRGDATLLGALLQNLLANAVKFTAAAGREPRVRVHAEKLAGAWRVLVDDNGPGVPETRRDDVFALLHRAVSDEVPGLGIGLSTCQRIVQAHGGHIGIDDAPGGGARVWFVLPAADTARAAA